MQFTTDSEDPLKGHERYKQIDSLGKGSFGFVVRALDARGNEEVAIKMLKRSEINRYVESEIVNHSMLRHPHVIQFREVFLTKEHICIVMEFASGGSLFQYVQRQGKLKESVSRWFFQQLMIGVDYCHKRGVANRDIKLENTLLHHVPGLPLPLLKICDFGYSKADFKSAAKSKVGTLTYMAPEVLLSKEQSNYDGKVADIWSCGVMLYVMLYGRYPFEQNSGKNQDIVQMLDKMIHMSFPMPESVAITKECHDLLVRMMQPEPGKRITLTQILAHPWFLTNLPPEAATMNNAYLANANNVPLELAVQQIKRLLQEARGSIPAPAAEEEIYDDVIDKAINEEIENQRNSLSQDLLQYVQAYQK